MTAPTPTLQDLEPLVPRVLNHRGDIFTRDVMDILSVSKNAVLGAVQTGKLESQGAQLTGNGRRARACKFDKLSLLRFLWRHRTGDKAAMLASLRAHCPALVHLITDGAVASAEPPNVLRPQFSSSTAPRRVNAAPICPPPGALIQNDFWDAIPAQPAHPALLPKVAKKQG